MRRLLVAGCVTIAALVGLSYSVFELVVRVKIHQLPEAVTAGHLPKVTAADAAQVQSLANLLDHSPLPWHKQQAQQFNDLLEVVEAAERVFQAQQMKHLRIGYLLTLQQEMQNFAQRYPQSSYTEALRDELPAVRALVAFFPIIKSTSAERSIASVLRASKRGTTLASLVIHPPEQPMVAVAAASATPVATSVSWTKPENDVLYDYSQALQPSERERLSDQDRIQIGRQICNWLSSGQGYWGVRTLFDRQFKGQVAGNYYHNRDAYIRFGTERLCPQHMATLVRPVDTAEPTVPMVVATQATQAATEAWNAAKTVAPAPAAAVPQYPPDSPSQPLWGVEMLPPGAGGAGIPAPPLSNVMPIQGGFAPTAPLPGSIR
ncbi:MAG: hypothetical protein IGS50_15155 [Synechococcales cyanobacterium C42_A2020_086]|jgi:hypothetical protein|nr:hypothetical protein [Synechococcales cyanobacterium C42_A2020_086]